MRLHIFNPEHELAQAANLRNFTPPHAGRQLRSDLAFIPALWADEGDLVLVDDIDDARDKARHLSQDLADKVEFVTRLQLEHLLKAEYVDAVHPWGWNLAVKGELERIGFPELALPTDDNINKVRTISGRQWAALHLQQGVSCAQTVEEAKRLVIQRGKAVIKAPWSSSGRGVRYVAAADLQMGTPHTSFENWVGNIIKQQGCVTIEPYYNKVKDFGMEFEMRDGKMQYCGLSLFDTIKNAYSGNVLAPEDEKIKAMESYVSEEELRSVSEQVTSIIEKNLKDIYSGPLGIDMMIAADNETAASQGLPLTSRGYRLVTCIELNLRRTMGHVALALTQHLANSNQDFKSKRGGVMRVEYDGNKYHLRAMPGRPSEEAPLH